MPRGALIRTLLDVLGIAPTPQSCTFADLPASHPYHDAIATAAALGLMGGDMDAAGNPLRTVRPHDNISRAEAAKLIAALLTGEFSDATTEAVPVAEKLPLGIQKILRPILYLRASPFPSADILKVLRRNELVSVISRTGPWAKIERQDGVSGYIYASSLSYVSDSWPAPEVYVVAVPLLHLRGGAFVDAAIKATLPKGSRVTVLRYVDVWAQVRTEDGQEGYVASYLLVKE